METKIVEQHWAVAQALEADAPGVYARGNLELLDARPIVAIVGARACTSYGSQVAAEVAREATQAGVHVVTGGGYGIAEAATRAVLAEGGKPIVWLAHGLDIAYPLGHADLLERVLEAGGLLLSHWPDGARPTRDRFASQCEAIGTFADLTVVVEAGARSGAMQTARHALEADRRVAAVPGPITSAVSAGSNALLADPRVAPVVDVSDIARMLEGAEVAA